MMETLESQDMPERESPAARAERLMNEARANAFEHTRVVDEALRGVIARARDIAEGGDAYPAPIRDFCGRLADDTDNRRALLEALAIRGLQPAANPRVGF